MDEKKLVALLKAEAEDAASYHNSELARAQADALQRYQAEPYGDELPNRSSVRTHDIEDAVNWAMPHLMRPFLSGDDLISVDDPGLDDGHPTLKQAADYLTHVFRKDNTPNKLIHDLAFDGLLQRVGIGRTWWEDPQAKPPRIMEGVTDEQMLKYAHDPEYEILEAERIEETAEGQPYTCYRIKLRHTPRHGRSRMGCIPPEEFRISRRARSIVEADYHAWETWAFLAEVIRDFPDFRDDLEQIGVADSYDATRHGDMRADARFPGESGRDTGAESDDIGRRKVTRHIEFIRCDFDGDGTVELRRVHRVGDVVLENDAVEESEFSAWSPVRMSHRAIGRSVVDQIADIQKIQTGLTRAALDGLSRSLTPRTAVNTEMADGDTYQDVADHDVGGIVRVRGDVRQAMQELTTPDVSANALAAMQFFAQRKEEASGIDSHAQGISPEAVTKTKGGIAMLQAAANARIELIARWLGECVEDMLGKAMRLLIAHQDGARMIKIQGKRVAIDPRRWSDEMTVTVHIGSVGEDRDAKLSGLGMIAAKQEQIMMQGGMGNPLVSPQEYRTTLALMAETMGHKSPQRFFREIPEGWQPPQPGKDPRLAEVEQKGQLAQAEMQQKGQLQAAEIQGKQRLAHLQAQASAQQAQQKADLERQVAEIKAANEREINILRLDFEREMAAIRMAQEKDLALVKMAQERDLAREKIKAGVTGAAPSGGDGFRDGGRLDA